jgi:hypothetical protein
MNHLVIFDQCGCFGDAGSSRRALIERYQMSQSEVDAMDDRTAILRRGELAITTIPTDLSAVEREQWIPRLLAFRQRAEDVIALNYLPEIIADWVYGVDKNGIPSRYNAYTGMLQSVEHGGFPTPMCGYFAAIGFTRENAKISHSYTMRAILYDSGQICVPYFYEQERWGVPQVRGRA